MTIHLGNVPSGSTLYIPFATYGKTNGESITLTGLAATDIEIYKNGSTTQRSSDNGYTLLDTDGIDFDGITGIHGFSVDLSDNSDAGFYAVGSFYWVVVSAVTIDSQTVNFVAATFRIVAAEATAGYSPVTVKSGTGTGELDVTSGIVKSNMAQVLGSATGATNLSKTTAVIGRGTVTTGASTTSVPTSAFAPAGAVADQFRDRTIIFDADTATTALRGQSRVITASSNSSTPTFTVTALTTGPASGDTFSVV